MSNRSTKKIPHYPATENAVKVKEKFALIEIITRYRSKTNGYIADRMSVMSILDKSGDKFIAKWDEDWTEIAPGIETKREHEVERTSIGAYRRESAKTGSIRIHRHACPVHVQLLKTYEYNDYDDSSFSTSSSHDYWVRYEA